MLTSDTVIVYDTFIFGHFCRNIVENLAKVYSLHYVEPKMNFLDYNISIVVACPLTRGVTIFGFTLKPTGSVIWFRRFKIWLNTACNVA